MVGLVEVWVSEGVVRGMHRVEGNRGARSGAAVQARDKGTIDKSMEGWIE